MDATTGIIIVLFVVTIFSSLGGNKGYAPPRYRGPSSPTELSQPAAPVPSSNVEPSFFGAAGESSRQSIQNYILRFRNPGEASAITSAIMRHSKAYDVNPKLVAALMRRESGYNPWARSSAGAIGLGQLMPATCTTTGVTNPYDIDDNAKGTVRYMKYLLDRFKNYSNQVSFALAGYLEGPNAVARNKGYSRTTAAYVKDIIEIYNKL